MKTNIATVIACVISFHGCQPRTPDPDMHVVSIGYAHGVPVIKLTTAPGPVFIEGITPDIENVKTKGFRLFDDNQEQELLRVQARAGERAGLVLVDAETAISFQFCVMEGITAGQINNQPWDLQPIVLRPGKYAITLDFGEVPLVEETTPDDSPETKPADVEK